MKLADGMSRHRPDARLISEPKLPCLHFWFEVPVQADTETGVRFAVWPDGSWRQTPPVTTWP